MNTTPEATHQEKNSTSLKEVGNSYLSKAIEVLKKYQQSTSQELSSELISLLEKVKHLDEPTVLSIARVINNMSKFNELVRDNVSEMDIGHRYQEITDMFTSIREDSKKLIGQLEDGKLGFSERMSNYWMKFTRGTPHARFEKIQNLFRDVSKSTNEQLSREEEILEGYIDFRFALKDAHIKSLSLLEKQEKVLATAKENQAKAQEAVTNLADNSSANKATTELARDEALDRFNQEDRIYQLLKDISENLSIGYSVGETLIAKLKQTHDVKDQVYRRSLTFFTTNEHVFTILDSVYTSQHGLHEATQTAEALKDGVNRGLEDIAELGDKLEKAALKAGYGSTFSPESVKKLVDAITKFQTESRELIEELRVESAKNAEEINTIVEDGKKRFNEVLK
jgi:hypothetical protein